MKKLIIFLLLAIANIYGQFGVDNMRVNTSLEVDGKTLTAAAIEKWQNSNYVPIIRLSNPQAGISYNDNDESITWTGQIQIRNVLDNSTSTAFSCDAGSYDWSTFGSPHLWICIVKGTTTNLVGYSLTDVNVIESDDVYPLHLILDGILTWSAFNMNFNQGVQLAHLAPDATGYINAGDAAVEAKQKIFRIKKVSRWPFTDESTLVGSSGTMPDSVFADFIVYGDSAYTVAQDTAKAFYLKWILENHTTFKWYLVIIDGSGTEVANWQSLTDPGGGWITAQLEPINNSGVYAKATFNFENMSVNYLFAGFEAQIHPMNVMPFPGAGGTGSGEQVLGTNTYTPDVSSPNYSSSAVVITPSNYNSLRPVPYDVMLFFGTKTDLSIGTDSKGGFFDTLNANGVIQASLDVPDCWGSPHCGDVQINLYNWIQNNLNAKKAVHIFGVSRGFLQALNADELGYFPVAGLMSAAGVVDVRWAYSESAAWADSIETHYGFTLPAQLDSSIMGYNPMERNRIVLSPGDTLRIGGTPMLIFHGDADTTVPLSLSTRFRNFLHRAGAHCRVDSLPGIGHGDNSLFNGPEAVKFIQRYGID